MPLVLNPNKCVNIILSDFFKHFQLDQYVDKKASGNRSYITACILARMLSLYDSKYANSSMIYNYFVRFFNNFSNKTIGPGRDPFTHESTSDEVDQDDTIFNIQNNQIKESDIHNIFQRQLSNSLHEFDNTGTGKKYNIPSKYVLLTGFQSTSLDVSHSVVIYIQKDAENSYTLCIINSGMGIDHDIYGKDKYVPGNEKGPVLIGWKGVEKENVRKIIIMANFSYYRDYRTGRYMAELNPLSRFNDGRYDFIFKDSDGFNSNNISFENNEGMKPFYNFIQKTIARKHDIIIIDDVQYSTSCSFHSILYTVKYCVFNCGNVTNIISNKNGELMFYNTFITFLESYTFDYINRNMNNTDLTNISYNGFTKFNNKFLMRLFLTMKDNSNKLIKDKTLSDNLNSGFTDHLYTIETDTNIFLNKFLPVDKNYYENVQEKYDLLKDEFHTPKVDFSDPSENDKEQLWMLYLLEDLLKEILTISTTSIIYDKKQLDIAKIFIIYILLRTMKIFELYYKGTSSILSIKKIDLSEEVTLYSFITIMNNIFTKICGVQDRKIIGIVDITNDKPTPLFLYNMFNMSIMSSTLSGANGNIFNRVFFFR